MEKKISIIIPVCNTEKYFDRCITSVLKQSYENLEIIVVNDGSLGDIDTLILEYQNKDSRIKYLQHEQNKGLFRARVTGMAAATGDYVAFLDSDDYISFDYYRTLLVRAEEKKADIVIGKTVWEEQDLQSVFSFHDSNLQFDVLEGNEVKDAYFSQEAACYIWHTVWNKLYKKELIDKCYPYFDRLQGHVIMTEDIGFSSILFYEAQRLAKVNESTYFYCANVGASTNTDGISLKKFLKNMQDMKAVFDHVDAYLSERGAEKHIRDHFANARKHYARLWQNLLNGRFNGSDKITAQDAMDSFCASFEMDNLGCDFFFESAKTPWNGGFESFKERILRGKEQFISFDIFDTLILRPFYSPEDLLELLNPLFTELTGSSVSFAKMRKAGERQARDLMRKKAPSFQDVTLTEIYEAIEELYQLEHSIVIAMMQKEIELEVRFCEVRKAGKSLLEMAKASGKTVFLVSDMYLETSTIEKILEKNGIVGYEKLYLSSAERKLKYDGDLFRCVVKEYPAAAGNMLHIGDTWASDIEGSKKSNVESIFLPKTKDLFENSINGYVTNRCANIGSTVMGSFVDAQKVSSNIGYRAMQALVAHKYFDYPYRPFHPESDFNMDPYFIGYYAVGMHMMGLCKWIHKEAVKKGSKKIHFLSRDGYLPMKAYEIYSKYLEDKTEVSYLQTSRKALLPMMVKQKVNFFQLPIEYRAHTPESLLTLLRFAMEDIDAAKQHSILKENGINSTKPFEEEELFSRFIRCFLDNFYSEEKHNQACKAIEDYFAQIKPGEIAFDMGYSGRIQAAISDACHRGVDVLFLHEDYNTSIQMKAYGNFDVDAFYDFRPSVTGLFREHMLSDCAGSCIGYQYADGQVTPIIEEEQKYYTDSYIVNSIHRGALQFVEDYMSRFGDVLEYMDYSSMEVSLPLEGFMRHFSAADLQIFSASFFEDEVYGGAKQLNIEAFLHRQTNQLNGNVSDNAAKEVLSSGNMTRWDAFEIMLCRRPKWIRGLIWILLDFDIFKQKLAKKLKRR